MAGAGVGTTVLGLYLHIVNDGADFGQVPVRAFDWTLEEGANEDAPVVAGDVACTIPASEVTPELFDLCVRRPAVRLDEVDVQMILTNGSRGGGYSLVDSLISSFRVQDGGGIVGLEGGLTTLTFDWRKVDVSWGGNVKTYQKPKG